MNLTWFECKMLRRICKRAVIQGYDHKDNIVEIYRILHQAAEEEFVEDNIPTLTEFMDECYQESKNELGRSRIFQLRQIRKHC